MEFHVLSGHTASQCLYVITTRGAPDLYGLRGFVQFH